MGILTVKSSCPRRVADHLRRLQGRQRGSESATPRRVSATGVVAAGRNADADSESEGGTDGESDGSG